MIMDDPKRQADRIIEALELKGLLFQWSKIGIENVRQTIREVLSPEQPTFEALALAMIDEPDDGWPKDAWKMFWDAYPRKEASGAGKKALDKVCKSGKVTFSAILVAVEVYTHKTRNKEPQFVCLPSTWLNQERWKDDPTAGIPNGCGDVKNGFMGRLME